MLFESSLADRKSNWLAACNVTLSVGSLEFRWGDRHKFPREYNSERDSRFVTTPRCDGSSEYIERLPREVVTPSSPIFRSLSLTTYESRDKSAAVSLADFSPVAYIDRETSSRKRGSWP